MSTFFSNLGIKSIDEDIPQEEEEEEIETPDTQQKGFFSGLGIESVKEEPPEKLTSEEKLKTKLRQPGAFTKGLGKGISKLPALPAKLTALLARQLTPIDAPFRDFIEEKSADVLQQETGLEKSVRERLEKKLPSSPETRVAEELGERFAPFIVDPLLGFASATVGQGLKELGVGPVGQAIGEIVTGGFGSIAPKLGKKIASKVFKPKKVLGTIGQRESLFGIKQEVLKTLEPEKKITSAAQNAFKDLNQKGAPTSLAARVTPQQTSKMGLKPTPAGIGGPIGTRNTTEAIKNDIGRIFTPNEIENTTEAGKSLIDEGRNINKIANERVDSFYDSSKRLNKQVNEKHPQLVSELEDFIAPIKKIAKGARSAAQKEIVTASEDLLAQLRTRVKGIGPDGKEIVKTVFHKANNQTLIDTIQSLRQKLNFDFANGAPKNIFKKPINSIQNSVERGARQAGKPAAIRSFQKARNAHREYTEIFDNPIYLNIRNRKNVANSGTFNKFTNLDDFNFIRPILDTTPKGQVLERQLAREIVESRLGKFTGGKEIKNLNISGINKELKELKSFVTPKENRQILQTVEEFSKGPRPIKGTAIKGTKFKKVSDIDKALNSREGIQGLRNELKKAGQTKSFDKLAGDKVESILTGGKITKTKLKGRDLVKIIEKENNFELLSELIGENGTKDLLENAQSFAKKEITRETAKNIVKGVASASIKARILKAILRPLTR